MGQIAEDMVSGLVCSDCGMFFRDDVALDPNLLYEHGYPAVCWDCWKSYSKRDQKAAKRAGLPRALMPTL